MNNIQFILIAIIKDKRELIRIVKNNNDESKIMDFQNKLNITQNNFKEFSRSIVDDLYKELHKLKKITINT